MSFAHICTAVYYWAAFETTWLSNTGSVDTAFTRIRWLRRHMIERGMMSDAS